MQREAYHTVYMKFPIDAVQDQVHVGVEAI